MYNFPAYEGRVKREKSIGLPRLERRVKPNKKRNRPKQCDAKHTLIKIHSENEIIFQRYMHQAITEIDIERFL